MGRRLSVYPIDIVDGINLRKDLKAIWQLKSVLRAAKPRLVHIHGLKSVMIGVPAAKLSGGSRLLFTAHNCLPQPQSRWYGVTHGLVNRRMLRSLDRIIAVSDAVGSELMEFVPYQRIVTIRNGVDYRRFEGYTRSEALAAMGLKADHFIIGVVARLIPEKGITCLLQAAALLQHILPQVRFVIVVMADAGTIRADMPGTPASGTCQVLRIPQRCSPPHGWLGLIVLPSLVKV